MRHRRHLRRLSLPVKERTAQAEVALVADRTARVPELRRADLVGHVLEHPRDLAIPDLVIQLAAELRVVALLVDRIRAAAVDVDRSEERRVGKTGSQRGRKNTEEDKTRN